MKGLASFLLALALLATGLPRTADAHPHVWIDTHATLRFDAGKLVALDVVWVFDDFFSSMMIEDFAAKGDKDFTPEGHGELESQVMLPMEEFGFFTHVTADGTTLKIEKIANFKASIEDGRVIFAFRALLPRAVDPRVTALSVGLYDESYYVELLLDEWDPFRLAGDAVPACAIDMTEDMSRPLYYGAFFPRVATLRCTGS